ncbi:MAG: type II secretion system protein [Dehalococcoidia bacterium]
MKSLIQRVRGIHQGQGGFTLIELMVVLAIMAIIVGLVVPNMFGIMGDAEAVQIQGQHEKMREAVFQYYADTSEFPTEWSRYDLSDSGNKSFHQLWTDINDTGDGTVGAWDGPYLDRPVLQENRWDGFWGVFEDVELEAEGDYYTVLAYEDVPLEVCREVDAAMDDGTGTDDSGQSTGVVQYDAEQEQDLTGGDGTPWYNQPDFNTDDANVLVIAVAKQDAVSGTEQTSATE